MSTTTTHTTDVEQPSRTAGVKGQMEEERKLESSIGSTAHAAGTAEIKKGQSIIDVVKNEHVAINQLFNEYKAATAGEVKEAKGWMMMKLLVQHSAREEAVLYPCVRAKLGEEGNALADRSEAEHQTITEDLYELDKLNWGQFPTEFNRQVEKTMQDTLVHVNEEESEILPKLAAKCTEKELIELGDRFQSQIVTTRPHPSAPHEGVAAQLAQFASKPVDALRDAVRFDEKTKAAAASK